MAELDRNIQKLPLSNEAYVRFSSSFGSHATMFVRLEANDESHISVTRNHSLRSLYVRSFLKHQPLHFSMQSFSVWTRWTSSFVSFTSIIWHRAHVFCRSIESFTASRSTTARSLVRIETVVINRVYSDIHYSRGNQMLSANRPCLDRVHFTWRQLFETWRRLSSLLVTLIEEK
jgi:hypothetical protein